MASRYTIEMDFKKAKQQADKLDNVANSLNHLSRKDFQGTLDSLSGNWKGDNALKYLKKGNQLQGNMDGTVKDLRKIAATIREIAKRIYDAEMENLRKAEKRHHH